MVNGKRTRKLVVAAAAITLLYYTYAWLNREPPVPVVSHEGTPPKHHKHRQFVANVENKVSKMENAREPLNAQHNDEKASEKLKCPNYVDYSKQPHRPFSKGKHQYPYMRPEPQCRTFTSSAVEHLIVDLKAKVLDDDLAMLIENCLPNTLDTTILWHDAANAADPKRAPQTFIVTGDIHAEWLRDSARQLSVYQPLVRYDAKLRQMILGAIETQSRYLLVAPYCNAFHPPPLSRVKRGDSAVDEVYPRPDWRVVFECKYELDSLASFLTLTNEYFEHSGGDLSFMTSTWVDAFEKVLVVLKRESQPSFDKETGQLLAHFYSFKRNTNIGSETLALGGVGNPVNYDTGLVRSAFRPSDDATILQFFIPANIHMQTELAKISKAIFTPEKIKEFNLEVLQKFTLEMVESMKNGIEQYGIVDHPKYGKVYAYEVDGYGGSIFMDDANIPSLLSIPETGYKSKDDPIYKNTRRMILEKGGNPYYLVGNHFEGIGGPHIGLQNAWPMSLLVRIRTSDDDAEILRALKFVMENTGDLGLMHESVHVNSKGGHEYTRSWFAWCNSEFGKTILHLARHKPHLIFKKEWTTKGYDIDEVFKNFSDIYN